MRKPGRSSEIPPPLELECLKALWRIGQGSVKDVREVLTENRRLAYTTVMTVLDRLAKRGAVARQKNGRAFLYEPLMDRDQARRLAVQELVDTYFGGSRQALVAYLGGDSEPVSPMAGADELDATLL